MNFLSWKPESDLALYSRYAALDDVFNFHNFTESNLQIL